MAGYPTFTEIEVAWRASGSGLCIIVEGETELQDPWFYRQWFGGEARRFTFFPQDGWEKVEEAVVSLRSTLGAKKVYGLRDRDFEPVVAYPPVPAQGVLRTPKYTLENYMLDPECWYKYVKPYTRRQPKAGWGSVDEVRHTIESLFIPCLPLSAYNWTLKQARNLNYIAFRALPENNRTYNEHPKALRVDVPAKLHAIQAQMGLAQDLGQMYLDRLAVVQGMSLAEWETVVSGKYVLKLLKENFPLKGSEQAWDDVLSAYIDKCFEPPDDLKTILDLIWQDSQSP